MNPPIVLFLDDGVEIYASIREAEFALEAIDVRKSPKWFGYGYDKDGIGVRLVVGVGERKSLFGKIMQDEVHLQSDLELKLSEDENAKLLMLEYIQRKTDSQDAAMLELLSPQELLHRVIALRSSQV